MLFPLCSVNAQSICHGNVISQQGEPIAFARLHILRDNKSILNESHFADKNGIFSFSLDTNIVSKARFIFASKNANSSDTVILKYNGNSVKLTVLLKVRTLKEIDVIAVRPVLLRKSDRFVFTPNKSIAYGASVLDVLRITPLISFDNKTSNFSIANTNGTIVYINGKKSTMPPDMINSLLKSTPAQDIRSIEIITNPGSEFGANIVGGIINVNLKRVEGDGFSVNMTGTSEQAKYNSSSLNGSINFRKNKLAIKVSPFLNKSFNYDRSYIVVEPVTNQFERTSTSVIRKYAVIGGGLGIDYDIDKKTLLSFSGFLSSVKGSSLQTSETRYNTKELTDSTYEFPTKGTDYYIYNFGNIYFKHSFDTSNSKELNINFDYNQFYKKIINYAVINKMDLNATSQYKGYSDILPERFFNLSTQVDYSYKVNSQAKISFGSQFSNTQIRNSLLYGNIISLKGKSVSYHYTHHDFSYHENYFAPYFSYSQTLNEKLSGTVGLRIEYSNYSTRDIAGKKRIDSTYINLFPSIAVTYSINSNNNITLAFNKKIVRPNFELLFPGRTYYNIKYYTENNPTLKPAILYRGEIIYSLSNKYYFTFGQTFYKNQFSQFIIPITDSNVNKQKQTYLNFGTSNTTYLSVFTSKQLFGSFWQMNISAAINLTHDLLNIHDYSFSKNGFVNLNYNVQIENSFNISTKKRWTSFVSLKYASPFENVSLRRLNSLYSIDFGVRKSYKHLSFSSYITDLFDTNSRTTIRYHSNSAFRFNEVKENVFSRSVAISIRYHFATDKLDLVKEKTSANEDLKSRIN